jgi:hypothetical protein
MTKQGNEKINCKLQRRKVHRGKFPSKDHFLALKSVGVITLTSEIIITFPRMVIKFGSIKVHQEFNKLF